VELFLRALLNEYGALFLVNLGFLRARLSEYGALLSVFGLFQGYFE